MAFYSLSEAEQHIMDYMWAHADQEEIHLNEIMEYMETKGYVWKQQTAYSFVIRLKNKKILSSTKRGKRRFSPSSHATIRRVDLSTTTNLYSTGNLSISGGKVTDHTG